MVVSWREGVPQSVQDDLDCLFETVEPFALQTLTRFRRLIPFGAAITSTGEIRLMGSVPEKGVLRTLEARTLLVEGLCGERDSLRAVVLVEDVVVEASSSDAIRFTLEHRDGPAIAVFAHYTVGGWPFRKVAFGERAADAGERFIWIET